MDKKIKASMSMLETYISQFNILNNKKIDSNNSKNNLQLQFDVGLPKDFEITENLILQVILKLKVNLIENDTNEEITEISTEIRGKFKFESKDKDTVISMLKYNATPLLYQEIRAYITSITSLSHNKVIYLPTINFSNLFDDNNN